MCKTALATHDLNGSYGTEFLTAKFLGIAHNIYLGGNNRSGNAAKEWSK